MFFKENEIAIIAKADLSPDSFLAVFLLLPYKEKLRVDTDGKVGPTHSGIFYKTKGGYSVDLVHEARTSAMKYRLVKAICEKAELDVDFVMAHNNIYGALLEALEEWDTDEKLELEEERAEAVWIISSILNNYPNELHAYILKVLESYYTQEIVILDELALRAAQLHNGAINEQQAETVLQKTSILFDEHPDKTHDLFEALRKEYAEFIHDEN